MARGVRKSTMEKLTEQLAEVQESVVQYESSLEALKEREKELLEDIEREKFHEITVIMKEKELSMDDLKALVAGQ